MSEFKKMFNFATNLNHKVVSSSTMDIYDLPPKQREKWPSTIEVFGIDDQQLHIDGIS